MCAQELILCAHSHTKHKCSSPTMTLNILLDRNWCLVLRNTSISLDAQPSGHQKLTSVRTGAAMCAVESRGVNGAGGIGNI